MILFKLSLLDWALIAILVYSIVISWYKGFVRQIIWLITLLAAVLLAAWFHHGVARLFKDVVRTENIALFLGFSLIFVVTLLVGFVTILVVTRFMKFVNLQWADRLLGAAFGFIRGWVICAAILLGLTAFDIQTQRLRSSELAPYFLPGSRVMALLTPYEMKGRFMVGYRALERWWRQQQS